jgi:uncharacterized membrane protein YeaQ/YmgE (transglycosylase-associated protein family)
VHPQLWLGLDHSTSPRVLSGTSTAYERLQEGPSLYSILSIVGAIVLIVVFRLFGLF